MPCRFLLQPALLYLDNQKQGTRKPKGTKGQHLWFLTPLASFCLGPVRLAPCFLAFASTWQQPRREHTTPPTTNQPTAVPVNPIHHPDTYRTRALPHIPQLRAQTTEKRRDETNERIPTIWTARGNNSRQGKTWGTTIRSSGVLRPFHSIRLLYLAHSKVR